MGLRDFNFVTGVETSSIPTITDAVTNDETPNYGQTNNEYTSSKTQGNNVADLTALKALITQGAGTPFGRVLGQAIYCKANNLFYLWTPASSLTSDGLCIVRPDDIATDGTAGRWLANPALLLRFANDTDFQNFRGAALAGGNMYFNTTTKTARLYDGAIFTALGGGGGGGASVEPIELKSQWEKQGVVYPLSTPNMLNEAFVDSTNVIITPRESYVSGTTFHADINKTDLDLMNATTGWTAGTNTPTITQNTTQKIEGSGSVMQTKSSLNGTIDMYKTFTAFSLYKKQFNFSIYLDTISNLLRAFVKIESSASNDKTYYFPVANLAAATWKHLSVDVNTDTADASTGTLDVSNITKIYFGLTTTTGQTISMSVDFLTYQDNYLLNVPYLGYIWDGTNQEEIKIASCAGAGNYQRNTYTIAALANGYATGAAYIKQRNLTILGNQGIFPTGLTGAVAKTAYDITDYSFPELVSAKTLVISQRFLEDEYKVSALPDTASLKFSCTADMSARFKSGDKVILFNKTWNGRKYESRYNATMLANFKVLTLTSDSTYSALETTLTFTGGNNSGANTSNWYIVRMSAEMLYCMNAAGENNSLSIVSPQVFMPSDDSIAYPSGLIAHYPMDAINSTTPDLKGGYNLTKNGTLNLVNGKFGGGLNNWSTSNYLNNSNAIFSMPQNEAAKWCFDFWILFPTTPSNQACILQIGANSEEINFGFDAGHFGLDNNPTTYGYRYGQFSSLGCYGSGRFHHLVINYERLASSSTSYINAWLDNVKVVTDANGGAYNGAGCLNNLKIGYSGTGNPLKSDIVLDDFSFYKGVLMTAQQVAQRFNYGSGRRYGFGGGYVMKANVDSLTGQQLRTATKLTRQDTTNQNPIILQRDAIIL